MLPHVIELSINHELKFKDRSILISVDFYPLCLLKPLVLHISACLIGPREIRMTRMKRITWFRGHLQSSRDKPFRHSEISASTLHYRVTPFSFSSMGATISTLGLNVDYRTPFLPATGPLNFTSFAACDFSSATAVSLRMWFKMNLFCPRVPIFWMKS